MTLLLLFQSDGVVIPPEPEPEPTPIAKTQTNIHTLGAGVDFRRLNKRQLERRFLDVSVMVPITGKSAITHIFPVKVNGKSAIEFTKKVKTTGTAAHLNLFAAKVTGTAALNNLMAVRISGEKSYKKIKDIFIEFFQVTDE